MYIPKHFEVTDKEKLSEFIREHSFGVLFSHTGGKPFATHLPFLLDEEKGCLFGHVARANPQWKWADGQQVLAMFQGPHTYVSPTWYGEPGVVPTWNYVTVHVNGTFKAIEDRASLEKIISKLVEFNESDLPDPWEVKFDERYIEKLLRGIVGFKIEIESMEGKWKLSQNRSVEGRERVVEALSSRPGQDAREIAELMAADLEQDGG